VSDTRTIPTGLSTTATIAALTWKRLLRGRALWVAILVSLLPVMFGIVTRSLGERPTELFGVEVLILAVLAPMLVGSSIGEEIEERTTTYLWSRPVQRWAVFAGKLVALAPLAAVIVIASWIVSARIAWDVWPPVQSCVALAAGAFTMSLLATGIATLAPRHGMALSIIYMLFFDFPIGILPATIRELSVAHQVRSLAGGAGAENDPVTAAIALAIIGLAWTLIAALRVRRLEA